MQKIVILSMLISSLVFGAGVKSVDNKLYLKECSSCHFAFQPGLLPKRSWVKMMGQLENHFDTDASLTKSDNQSLLSYMIKNSSDNAMNYKRSKKMTYSISKNSTPLKISEVPYFKKKHRELSVKMINQEEVKTISNCLACHKNASFGDYDDTYVPNYGRVDD